MSDFINITGLWQSHDKNGNLVLSGSIGGARILITYNNFKSQDNHPDYNLSICKKLQNTNNTSNSNSNNNINTSNTQYSNTSSTSNASNNINYNNKINDFE